MLKDSIINASLLMEEIFYMIKDFISLHSYMNANKKYTQGKLLRTINSPSDLRKLNLNQLDQVCKELRQYIIDIVSEKGGHFGASLGVIELTVALHYVFNTPNDQLLKIN